MVAEALTVGLITIWFAVGAFVAMLLALIGVPVGIQIIAFIGVSALCLVFFYPIVKKRLKFAKEKTNYETVINQTGEVTESIDNIKGVGQVKVGGQIWSARSSKGGEILKGNRVLIKEVQGVKLIVEELE